MKKTTALILILAALFWFCACADTPKPEITDTAALSEIAAKTGPVTEPATGAATKAPEAAKPRTFKNPVSTSTMPDPYIIYYGGYYYGLATEAFSVKLYRGKRAETLFSYGKVKTLISTGDSIGGGNKLGGNIWRRSFITCRQRANGTFTRAEA